MTVLKWRRGKGVEGFSSNYGSVENSISISDADVEDGSAHLSLAHELAHKREGILHSIWEDTSEEIFYKELATWESALRRLPHLTSEEREDVIESLTSYLENAEEELGRDHPIYRKVVKAYNGFKRRYL